MNEDANQIRWIDYGRLSLALAFCALILVTAACGHGRNHSGVGSLKSGVQKTNGNTAQRHSFDSGLKTQDSGLALDAVLRDIDAYPAPKGVDAARFAALKAELKRLLIGRAGGAKTIAVAPVGSPNQVTDLAAVPNVGATQATLTWTEMLSGDCSNDGQVDISDLQPIATHYGENSTGPGSAPYLADANGDGQVGISDLQPIANNYGAHLEGYQVWRGHFNGTTTDWETTCRPNSNPANPDWSADRPSPPLTSRPSYTYVDDITGLTDKNNVRYEVTAFGDGAAGAESNEAAMPAMFTVSGTVTESGAGLAGVTVTLAPGGLNATTQADGTYAIANVADGSYTLTPTKDWYGFTPSILTVVVAGADVTGQDFAARTGLADTPWPKFHGDARNTGLSPYAAAQTNALRWTFDLPIMYSVNGSPVIGADGTVYFECAGDYHVNVYALNPSDGSAKWSYSMFSYGSGLGTPAVGADGTIYVGDIGSHGYDVYALSPLDGSVKWTYETAYVVQSSPTISADGTIYIGSEDTYVYALHPDGRLKRSYRLGDKVTGSPAIGPDGTIYVGSWDYKVYALSPDFITPKWSSATGGIVSSSPAIGEDGTIYVGSQDGKVYALDPADGSVNWTCTTGGAVVSSPAIGADGTVYVGSGDRSVYALNPSDGSVKWTRSTGDLVASSPAIGADGTIYVGSTDFSVYALNPSDGSIKWSYVTGDMVYGSPAIGADGTVYVGGRDYKVYAFGP